MQAPEKPFDESSRLNDLHALNVLDTPISNGFESITRLAKAMFNVPIVAISLVDSERQWFKSVQGLDVCETSRHVSFCGHAILQDNIFVINDASKDPRFSDNPLVKEEPFIRFYAGCPIKSKNSRNIGTLCLIDQKPRAFLIEELSPLIDMAHLVESELMKQNQSDAYLALVKEFDEMKRASMIDSLTRIWNRSATEKLLTKQIILNRKKDKSLALFMIDIDDFKQINDSHGHLTGDQILREVVKRILRVLRENDILGRWGGEEFLGIIDVNDAKKAYDIANRCCREISKMPIEYEEILHRVTITIGLLMVSPDINKTLEQMIFSVDRSLYEGKKTGKNRVAFSDNV